MGKSKNTVEKILLLGFLSIILLHILGGFWHSFYSWGFSHWATIPNTITLIIGSISILSVLTLYLIRNKFNINFIDEIQLPNKSKSVTTIYAIIISIIIGLFLYTFRSQALIYGDGYAMLDFCSTTETLEFIGQHYLQILALYWYQLMYKIFSIISSLNKEEIFALTNTVGGVVGFWGIYKISGVLSRSRKEQLFFIIISLSSASIILFFGYIENYTLATSFMLWSLYYSIRYIQKSCRIFPLLFFSLLAFAFHMITLPALVTAVFVILYRKDSFKKFIDNVSRLYLILFVLLGSLLILFLAQLKGLSTFVPIWSIPNNNYSLFSLSHLSDIFNLLLLLAPLGLLFFFFSLKNNELKNDSTEKVLFLISLLTFLSACVIDPQLGMIRDFDLLSFFGIPLTLWAGYRFSRMYDDNKIPLWIIIASSILVLVHILPNLYEKNHPNIAVEHLEKVLWNDPHYQQEYQDAFRGVSWGLILQQHTSKGSLAEKYFLRSMNSGSRDTTPYYNLGALHNNNNRLDSARYYLEEGHKLNPYEARFLSLLAEVAYKENNILLAEKYAKEALAIDSNSVNGLTALGLIYHAQNKDQDALFCFKKAYDLEPTNYNSIKNLGFLFSNGIDIDSAYYYLRKSLLFAPDKQKPIILVDLISLSKYLKHTEEMEAYLKQLKSITPNSPILKKLEEEINKN